MYCLDASLNQPDNWHTIEALAQLHQAHAQPLPPTLLLSTLHQQQSLVAHLAHLQNSTPALAHSTSLLIKPITASALFDAVAVATQGQSAQGQQAHSAQAGALAAMRILLTEDNPLNQEIAQALLTQAGAVITLAHNGAEALEHLQQQGVAAFDAVLMDIQMPVMDGLEATRRIRQHISTSLPIIAMTANAHAQDRAQCLAAGMNEHLPKPIDQAQLIACLLQYKAPVPDAAAALPASATPQPAPAPLA